MENGIAIVTTDARHTPSGLTLPFHRHHRQAGVAADQIALGLPTRKRMWQAIVRAKICNQASVLGSRDKDSAAALAAMAERVRSGDPDIVEARAARHYWGALFDDFRREGVDDRRTAMLNYGYAVARACVARAVVAAGFLPAIGLHHSSQTNQFNLADDLLEAFRPFVDAVVLERAGHEHPLNSELTLEDRRALAGVPLVDVKIGEESMTLLASTELVADSLARAVAKSDARLLILPKLSLRIEDNDCAPVP